MRSAWRLWATIVALVVLHFLLHVGFGIGRGAPDLLTVALLLAARELRMGMASVLGFAFGLLEDAFNVLAFGANTLAMTLVAALGTRTRALFLGDSLLFVVLYLAVGKWFRDLVVWGVVGEGLRGPFGDALLVDASLGAVYAAASGLVALLISGARTEGRA